MPQNQNDAYSKRISNLALALGKALLKSGAETHRVEETLLRFTRKNGCMGLHIFVTPTIIILGREDSGGDNRVARILSRSTNLHAISQINSLSYKLMQDNMSYEEAQSAIDRIASARPLYNGILTAVSSAFCAACFTRLLGGSNADFIAALFVGGIAMLLLKLISGYRPSAFWENAVVGAAIAALAILCSTQSPACTMPLIIGGSLMPFLPGTAFVNSLRDYMAGDLVSGNSRLAEALLFAVSIASGLAAVLHLWKLSGDHLGRILAWM